MPRSKKKVAKSKSNKNIGNKTESKTEMEKNDNPPEPPPPTPPPPPTEEEIAKRRQDMMGLYDIIPGPGQYILPSLTGYIEHDITRPCEPAYSLGVSRKKKGLEITPGPTYNFEEYTRFGKPRETSAFMTGRPINIIPKDMVGPGKYNIEEYPNPRYKKSPEAVLIGRPRSNKVDRTTPGPGQYGPPPGMGDDHPTIGSSSAAILCGRSWDRKPSRKDVTPGPNAYTDYETDTFMKTAPSAPLIGRPKFKPIGVGPGPGHYNADFDKYPTGPSFSFGMKHSKRAGTFYDPCDNEV